jgi:hypothetical protein
MQSVKYFQSTLYELKNNNVSTLFFSRFVTMLRALQINVVFYAGQKSAGTITTALHQGYQ